MLNERIFSRLAAVALLACTAAAATSCSDDDGGGNGGDPGTGMTTRLTMYYAPTGDLSRIGDIAVLYTTGDTVQVDTVKGGQVWQKTVDVSAAVDTVGMEVFALNNPADTTTATVDISYKLSVAVALMDGANIHAIDTVDTTESYTVELEPIGSRAEQVSAVIAEWHYFAVGGGQVKKLDYEKEFGDPAGDGSIHNPLTDEDEVKMDNMLYYTDQADIQAHEDSDCLLDNLTARFPNKALWNGHVLGKGDVLLLRGSGLGSADMAAVRQSMAAGAICVIDDVDTYRALDDFCAAADVTNALSEEDFETPALYILADADVDMSADQGTPVRGFFYMLTPTDDNGGLMNDYQQGQCIDMALTSIKEVQAGSPAAGAAKTRQTSQTDLQTLADMFKVYKSGAANLEGSDYRRSSIGKRVANYSIEYDIYNAFSLGEKRNYYYIHQQIMADFNNVYAGIYSNNVTTDGCHTIAKVCEWYGSEVETTMTPDAKSGGMQIHQTAPGTTQLSASHTTGLSLSLNGEFGFNGENPEGGISGGISIENSRTETIPDVSITETSSPGTKVGWKFGMSGARTTFMPIYTAATNMHEGALVGRSTFTTVTDCMVSFPEGTAPVINGTVKVTLRSTCGKCGVRCGERTKGFSTEVDLVLPYLTSADFNK